MVSNDSNRCYLIAIENVYNVTLTYVCSPQGSLTRGKRNIYIYIALISTNVVTGILKQLL